MSSSRCQTGPGFKMSKNNRPKLMVSHWKFQPAFKERQEKLTDFHVYCRRCGHRLSLTWGFLGTRSQNEGEVPGLIPSHSCQHTQGLQQSEVSQNWCFLSPTMSLTHLSIFPYFPRQRQHTWDFPGSPAVKTLPSNAGRYGFDPWWRS